MYTCNILTINELPYRGYALRKPPLKGGALRHYPGCKANDGSLLPVKVSRSGTAAPVSGALLILTSFLDRLQREWGVGASSDDDDQPAPRRSTSSLPSYHSRTGSPASWLRKNRPPSRPPPGEASSESDLFCSPIMMQRRGAGEAVLTACLPCCTPNGQRSRNTVRIRSAPETGAAVPEPDPLRAVLWGAKRKSGTKFRL